MFTGIIEKTGVVSSLEGKKLTLQARFHKISLGESVAVNGCCLTVVSKKEGRLVFDLSEETLQKTNLGQLKKGSKVNLGCRRENNLVKTPSIFADNHCKFPPRFKTLYGGKRIRGCRWNKSYFI